ncbi:MAG: hypothetical protein U0931_29870 [Vulcanimicrobiota bacterium]
MDATRLTQEQRELVALDSTILLYTPTPASGKTGKKAKNLLFQRAPRPPQWPMQLRRIGVAGVDTLWTAQSMGDYLQGAAELGGSTASFAAKAAKFQGAARLAGGLGVAGVLLDGSSDLVRGIRDRDAQALALAGLKGGAGALMFVPGGGLASGGILLGASALENREWLACQIQNGWREASQWWTGA